MMPGANSRPRQPASQGSKLHASAPSWDFCPKPKRFRPISQIHGFFLHFKDALIGHDAPFWRTENLLYKSCSKLEQFPL
ncbi:conserved protein of unknown function [Pseudomonas sp. JV241A]|nr:conserved protein of unknown function [Pseudomonas sp. JV241A]